MVCTEIVIVDAVEKLKLIFWVLSTVEDRIVRLHIESYQTDLYKVINAVKVFHCVEFIMMNSSHIFVTYAMNLNYAAGIYETLRYWKRKKMVVPNYCAAGNCGAGKRCV